MNGYGSQRNATTKPLTAIQIATRIVWPTMNLGVPKKRANFSAAWPKRSCPNAPRKCSGCPAIAALFRHGPTLASRPVDQPQLVRRCLPVLAAALLLAGCGGDHANTDTSRQ